MFCYSPYRGSSASVMVPLSSISQPRVLTFPRRSIGAVAVRQDELRHDQSGFIVTLWPGDCRVNWLGARSARPP